MFIAIVAALVAASSHHVSRTSTVHEAPVCLVAPTRPRTERHAYRRAYRGQTPTGELFSLRARRRFAAYLRIRLLEMREEGLERAAEAVERRLPVDELLELKR